MPNDDTVGKGGWGGENVSKSDGAILECSLKHYELTNKHATLGYIGLLADNNII